MSLLNVVCHLSYCTLLMISNCLIISNVTAHFCLYLVLQSCRTGLALTCPNVSSVTVRCRLSLGIANVYCRLFSPVVMSLMTKRTDVCHLPFWVESRVEYLFSPTALMFHKMGKQCCLLQYGTISYDILFQGEKRGMLLEWGYQSRDERISVCTWGPPWP